MAVPTLTANSPVNGSIAWSAFSIQYGGVSYSVPASSTALKYVYWLYNNGTPSLQANNTLPTLADDDLLLFINKAGVPINVPASNVVDGSLIVDGTIVGSALIANTVHGDAIQGGTLTIAKTAGLQSAIDGARTGAVSDVRTLWGHASNSTLIDGGDIYTNSIRAASIQLADWNNYFTDRYFTFGNAGGLPNGGIYSETPPAGGNAIVLASRDHIVSPAHMPRVAARPGDEFLIQITYKRFESAPTPKDIAFGIWVTKPDGTESTDAAQRPWSAGRAKVGTDVDLGNGWIRTTWRAWVPAALTQIGMAQFYAWINQSSATGFTDKLAISDVVFLKRNGADLIVDGGIVANKIAANTMTLKQLAIGSFENLLYDPTFQLELGDASGWRAQGGAGTSILPDGARNGGRAALIVNSNVDQILYNQAQNITAEAGDTFNLSAWIKQTTAIAANGVFFSAEWKRTDGTSAWTEVNCPAVAANTWARFAGKITAPANATQLTQVSIRSRPANSTGNLTIDYPTASRAMTGELIVNGAVVADHLDTNSVTTAKLAADAITAKHTITGAVLQTVPDAARGVKILGNSVIAYTSAGGEGVVMNGSDGTLTVTGPNSSITGAKIRTAASGERMELSTDLSSKVLFYSGLTEETSPSIIEADDNFAGESASPVLSLAGGRKSGHTGILPGMRLATTSQGSQAELVAERTGVWSSRGGGIANVETASDASGNAYVLLQATKGSVTGKIVVSSDGRVTINNEPLDEFAKLGDIRWTSDPSGTAYSASKWLPGDGRAISRTTYAAYFAKVGTTYGAGDGVNTFNIPNFSGRSPLGAGTATGATGATNHPAGQRGGEETHLLLAAESGLPSHTHPLSHVIVTNTGFGANLGTAGVYNQVSGSATGNSAQNAASSHNTMHPFQTVPLPWIRVVA